MIVTKTRKRDIDKIGLKGGRETSTLRPRYRELTPPCTHTCPSGIDIRRYMTTIAQSEGYKREYKDSFNMAWEILTDKNPLPAVTGRVCPHPCEKECNRSGKDEALSINSLERTIGDWGLQNNLKYKKLYNDTFPEKVAVIGSGPSGLSCAYQLARKGYRVVVFEKQALSGGMLRYGIPEYRLLKDILDAEIKRIEELGIEIRCNTKKTIDELKGDYNAIYVAIGAQEEIKPGIPGENLPNVLSGIKFLEGVNSGKTPLLGKKVAVIGGGNSAIDSARSAQRLGCDVIIIYRRTRDEMPAITDEVESAMNEGIKFEFLASPVEIMPDNIKCIRMKLGENDASGRRSVSPISDSFFDIKIDSVIVSIGQKPELSFNEEKGVFFGGDVVKIGFVTEAIGAGRNAALAIDDYLREKEALKVYEPPVIKYTSMNLNYYEKMPRKNALNQDDAIYESKRCMSCGSCFDCDNCYILCSDSAVKKLPKGQHYEFVLSNCQGCKKCAEECPCGYVEMV